MKKTRLALFILISQIIVATSMVNDMTLSKGETYSFNGASGEVRWNLRAD